MIEAAREAVGLAMALEESQAKLASNGSRPSGALTTDSTLKVGAAQRLREEWGAVYGGAGNTGRVVVLDGGFKFQPMAMTGVDAQHLETRRHQVEEICRIMGVPASRIGYSDKAQTYASAQQFAIDYLRHTIGVWVRRWEEELSAALLTEAEVREGYVFRFETKGFLRGDDQARAGYYKAALGTASSPGWMSPNDVRRAEDMDPVDQEGAEEIVTVDELAGAPAKVAEPVEPAP
jgi:HK97 family phage portal protein